MGGYSGKGTESIVGAVTVPKDRRGSTALRTEVGARVDDQALCPDSDAF